MNSGRQQFFATCPRGLESLLGDELAALGAQALKPTDGGVGFSGDQPLVYRANLESRIATRILWQVGEGSYRSEDDLYQATLGLPWPDWFDVRHTFMVKVTGVRCPLKSLEFATLRIKDAVCDKFRAVCGSRPDIDTKQPDVRIHAYLAADRYRLYLDTSGAALFMRGMRKTSVDAPLRENLAAGILRLSGWKPGEALLDPMCGSGTFLLEAALMALDVAPGLGRSFGFQQLKNFDAASWQVIRRQAEARCKPVTFAHLYASDVDPAAIRAVSDNLASAGLSDAVRITRADILEIAAPEEAGVMVANPPYGVRIGEEEALAELYPQLGAALKRNFPGWRAYFLTSDMRMPKMMRLSASRRTPLFNGALECRLFEIKLVAGSNRKSREG